MSAADLTFYIAFQDFVKEHSSDLRRIADQTRGEMSFDDIQQEAWILAVELSEKRAGAFDLTDPDDQGDLRRWLHNRYVKYTEKKVRNRFKLKDDRREDEDDEKSTPSTIAAAPPESNPLI